MPSPSKMIEKRLQPTLLLWKTKTNLNLWSLRNLQILNAKQSFVSQTDLLDLVLSVFIYRNEFILLFSGGCWSETALKSCLFSHNHCMIYLTLRKSSMNRGSVFSQFIILLIIQYNSVWFQSKAGHSNEI